MPVTYQCNVKVVACAWFFTLQEALSQLRSCHRGSLLRSVLRAVEEDAEARRDEPRS